MFIKLNRKEFKNAQKQELKTARAVNFTRIFRSEQQTAMQCEIKLKIYFVQLNFRAFVVVTSNQNH